MLEVVQKIWYDGFGVIQVTTGQKIKEARKKAGLTQKELGQKLGLSFQAIAQWENDLRNPKFETLKKISDALGVSTSWLIYGEGDPDQISLLDLDVFEGELKKAVRKGNGAVELSESSAKKILDDLQNILDDALEEADWQELFRLYQGLNREGQRVALERLDELAQLPKYQRQPAQEGQQTEQSTPGGAEDKTDQA